MTSRYTSPRIRKAIIHRLRTLVADGKASAPVGWQTFAHIEELKQHALSTSEVGNRFRYSVQLRVAAPPMGIALHLGNVRSADISYAGGQLRADISLAAAVAEGEVAWAVAMLAQPALRPLASWGSDVAVEDSLDPALAMGHRLVFGGFGSSDAAAMEAGAALRPTEGQREVPYFDLADWNPIGLRLRESADRLPTCAIDLTGGLLPYRAQIDASAAVTVTGVHDSWRGAAELAALCATGRVVHASRTPSGLNSDLAALIGQPLPGAAGDSVEARLQIQARSALQRRLAMLNHAGALRLPPHWPTVSVLLVTNRAAMLAPALERIAAQTYRHHGDALEVLVGLHNIDGAVADAELAAARAEFGERLRAFHFEAGANLGEIYGKLTERADGVLIAKMDDDDLYGVEHIRDAVMSLRYSGAGLFGRVPAATWLEGSGELLLRPFGAEEIYNKYIIGGTMVMSKAALLEVGGWRPTQWAVDKALIDRFRQHGAGIYRASALGWAYVRHNHGHTWEKEESHFRGQAEASWTGADAQRLLQLVLGA